MSHKQVPQWKKKKKKSTMVMDEVGFLPTRSCMGTDFLIYSFTVLFVWWQFWCHLPSWALYLFRVPCYCKKASVWSLRCHILLLCQAPGFSFQLRDQLPRNALMWHCRTIRIPLGLPFPGGDVCTSQYEVTAAALSLMPCNHVIPHPVRKCKKCSQNQKLQRFLVFLNI